MKIILLKNIDNLGVAGDIKEVSDGYARNFLFPGKLAEIATEENIKKIEREKEEKARRAEQDLIATEKIAEKLNDTVIEIREKINEAGKLYAAITSAVIIKALKEKGFEIRKDQINLPEPIKEIGEYPVFINLDHNLEAEITVMVNE